MDQLIKLNNKNSIHKNDQNSIKIAFQSGILKYVQRKKKELTGFSTLNGKLKSFEDKIIPADSNLISKITETNFYQSRKQTEPKMCSDFNFDLIDRKPRHSFIKRKIKGHKSSLSDWRDLYGQRDQIVTNKEKLDIFEDKMTVTERLFYPAKKMTTPNFQNQEIKRASCKQINQPQKRINSKKIMNKKQQLKEQEKFVSDENYYHFFYRSKTPFLFTDEVQNKRITKYLKENKHRRHQSLYGLGRLNEGFSELFYKDKNYSKQLKNKSMLEKEFDDQSIIVKNVKPKNKISVVKKGKNNQLSIKAKKSQKQDQSTKIINPQKQQSKNKNQIEDKNLKNLSQILCIDLKIQQNKALNLRQFKPRKNKIQKAISNIKSSNSYQNLCKAKNPIKKYSVRQTSTNWTTLYSNFRD